MRSPGASVVLSILAVLPANAVADEWPVSRAPTVASPLVTSDSLGRLTSVTTAEGTTRDDYFDGNSQPLIARITHPDGSSESYTLDLATTAFLALSEPPTAGTSSSPCSGSNHFAFNGYLAECELGLYYTPSGRLYDPAVGRFLQQDSYLGETSNPPSLHRYTFGHNNPTTFVDPTGHESYRQWIHLDNPSADVGHEFLKQFGYNAFNALSFGALARQDALVEQSEAGRISETRYQAGTGVNLVGSSVAAAATIYTAGAAASATASAVAPLTAATELGVPLLPSAAATIAGGAAGGGAAGLVGAALSDDLGMLTGTTSPLDVHPGDYVAPTALGAVTGGIFGAGAAAGVRPFRTPPVPVPPEVPSGAVVIAEGPGGGSATNQVRLIPIGEGARPPQGVAAVKWVDEGGNLRAGRSPGMPADAYEYQSSAVGARSNPVSGRGQAPQLEYTDANGQPAKVKFDGLEGNQLIDRKTAIHTGPKTQLLAQRQSAALRQHELTAVWEVPDAVQAERAAKVLRDAGVSNISIKIKAR